MNYSSKSNENHGTGWTIAESLTELGGVSLSMETDCPHDIEGKCLYLFFTFFLFLTFLLSLSLSLFHFLSLSNL